MSKTRKQSKVLCYTGTNSKPNGIHTPDEFLNITRKFAKSKGMCYGWKDGKYKCPKKNNLDGWVEWTGATYTNAKTCRKDAAEVQKGVEQAKKDAKKLEKVAAQLKKCQTRKCRRQDAALKKETEIFNKLVKEKCTNKSLKTYMKCVDKLYSESDLKTVGKQFDECEGRHCAKEQRALKQISRKFFKI